MHLAIALVAFAAGVTAATVFNAAFGAAPASPFIETRRPDPPRKRPCPHSRQIMSELPPLPELPALKRIVNRFPDGTVQVIESRAGKKVELKF